MSNARLFDKWLFHFSEIEKEYSSFPCVGIEPKIEKGTKKGSRSIKLQHTDSMPCLPYNALRGRLVLDDEGGENRDPIARQFLDSLPEESEFSVRQVIDALAHALWFDSERPKLAEIMEVARAEYRDSHLIEKNRQNGQDRARGRAIAALVLQPSISNATRWKTDSDARIPIQLHKFGCAYYPQDRLLSSKQPSTEALLAFNLEFIFRRWPVPEATFPTYPPKKQPRGKQPELQQQPVKIGKPRLDIVAYFVTALFPPENTEPYNSEQIKSMLNKMKAANAVFCGW